MSVFYNKDNFMFDTQISDLCVRSILDMGFEQRFIMSPKQHNHIYYELLFALEGTFYVKLSDGNNIQLDEGDFCFIPPTIYHSTISDNKNSKKLGLRFRYEQNNRSTALTSVYSVFHRVMSSLKNTITILGQKDMSNLFANLRDELLGNQLAKQDFVSAILNQIYLLLLRKISNLGEGDDKLNYCDEQEQRRIGLESYFEQNFDKPITEEHLAQQMHLSKRQVSRILREIYGKSFRQILISTRINCAKQLLESTTFSLDEIATMVGYDSLSGFCYAFNKTLGITVGQYRKKFNNI